jgi:flagellar biosynthesis protein FlhG
MANEAIYLQEMPASCRCAAQILTVTAGKGGVGKTNIAANLAICLSSLQKKVLLVDADISLGNLDIIMGISSRYNISHIVSGQKTIEQVICPGPGHIQVVCAGSGIERLANINEFQRHRLLQELFRLQQHADTIVIDTPAGISKSAISFCLAADHVLVVTTPEATAITGAYGTIKVLTQNFFQGPISIIVNMAESIAEGRKTYRQIAYVAKRFLGTHVYDAGILLKDDRLTSAVKLRTPVVLAYPKSQTSSALTALAAKLGVSIDSQTDVGRFTAKIVNWFT